MSINILVMDNSPHIQKTLHYFLSHYSPKIYGFDPDNQSQAISQKPDIVFLDTRFIGQEKKLQEISNDSPPIVLLFNDESHLKDPLEYQAKLKKPINPEELKKIVNDLVPKTKSLQITDFIKFNTEKENPKTTPDTSLKTSSTEDPKKSQGTFVSEISIPSFNQDKTSIAHQDEISIVSKKSILTDDKNSEKRNLEGSFSNEKIPPINEETSFNDLKFTDKKEIQSLHETTSAFKEITDSLSLNNPSLAVTNVSKQPAADVKPLEEASFESKKSQEKEINIAQLENSIFQTIEKKIMKNLENFIDQTLKAKIEEMILSKIEKISTQELKGMIEQESLKKIQQISDKTIPDIARKIIREEVNKRMDEEGSS